MDRLPNFSEQQDRKKERDRRVFLIRWMRLLSVLLLLTTVGAAIGADIARASTSSDPKDDIKSWLSLVHQCQLTGQWVDQLWEQGEVPRSLLPAVHAFLGRLLLDPEFCLAGLRQGQALYDDSPEGTSTVEAYSSEILVFDPSLVERSYSEDIFGKVTIYRVPRMNQVQKKDYLRISMDNVMFAKTQLPDIPEGEGDVRIIWGEDDLTTHFPSALLYIGSDPIDYQRLHTLGEPTREFDDVRRKTDRLFLISRSGQSLELVRGGSQVLFDPSLVLAAQTYYNLDASRIEVMRDAAPQSLIESWWILANYESFSGVESSQRLEFIPFFVQTPQGLFVYQVSLGVMLDPNAWKFVADEMIADGATLIASTDPDRNHFSLTPADRVLPFDPFRMHQELLQNFVGVTGFSDLSRSQVFMRKIGEESVSISGIYIGQVWRSSG